MVRLWRLFYKCIHLVIFTSKFIRVGSCSVRIGKTTSNWDILYLDITTQYLCNRKAQGQFSSLCFSSFPKTLTCTMTMFLMRSFWLGPALWRFLLFIRRQTIGGFTFPKADGTICTQAKFMTKAITLLSISRLLLKYPCLSLKAACYFYKILTILPKQDSWTIYLKL